MHCKYLKKGAHIVSGEGKIMPKLLWGLVALEDTPGMAYGKKFDKLFRSGIGRKRKGWCGYFLMERKVKPHLINKLPPLVSKRIG